MGKDNRKTQKKSTVASRLYFETGTSTFGKQVTNVPGISLDEVAHALHHHYDELIDRQGIIIVDALDTPYVPITVEDLEGMCFGNKGDEFYPFLWYCIVYEFFTTNYIYSKKNWKKVAIDPFPTRISHYRYFETLPMSTITSLRKDMRRIYEDWYIECRFNLEWHLEFNSYDKASFLHRQDFILKMIDRHGLLFTVCRAVAYVKAKFNMCYAAKKNKLSNKWYEALLRSVFEDEYRMTEHIKANQYPFSILSGYYSQEDVTKSSSKAHQKALALCEPPQPEIQEVEEVEETEEEINIRKIKEEMRAKNL